MTPPASGMVYLPVSRERARRLREGEVFSGPGHAATVAMRVAHGLPAAGESEDAEFTAFGYAGLRALSASAGLRLVLAAEVDPGRIEEGDDPLGTVVVGDVSWRQVGALFADAVESGRVVAAARLQAGDRSVAELADDARLEALLAGADLLWFGPGELDLLPGAVD